jgi:DNA-binding NarL/FixJ family response regulator
LRILIVDDEPLMIETLKRFLNPLSSKIDSTDALDDALKMASVGNYNVIVLDLRLRFTGKPEALRAIQEFKRHNAAVVVVSGLPEPNLSDEVLAAGADVFVPKDKDFGRQAMLMAANIATLKLPEGSYKSDSYGPHVELLRQMVKEPANPKKPAPE